MTDEINDDRRQALRKLGLTATAAYTAPLILGLRHAGAQDWGGGWDTTTASTDQISGTPCAGNSGGKGKGNGNNCDNNNNKSSQGGQNN